MDSLIQEKIDRWTQPPFDEDTINQVLQLKSQSTTLLQDSFYKDLEFGTGGLRNLMGVGTNRINKYTISMATQGFATYLKHRFCEKKLAVAIGYDTRINSSYFAKMTAEVFSANGIQVFLFDAITPTPLLSFAVIHLGCVGGVMITASHNPKEYNGYKAFNEYGAQYIAPQDKKIIEQVRAVTIEKVEFQANNKLIVPVSQDIEKKYFATIEKYEFIKGEKDIHILYTPIHGTGIRLVPPMLDRFGFVSSSVLSTQQNPDGHFPTVKYPNPEDPSALALAFQQAQKQKTDVIFATDPDADRLAVAVRNHKNEMVLLNGNQTASIALYYLLSQLQSKNRLHQGDFVAKTIVTTDLFSKIADHFHVRCLNTLTGFKHIAALIEEEKTRGKLILGAEESFGLMLGDAVRDKDAVSAIFLLAQAAMDAKRKGKSLWDILLSLYLKFNLFHENLFTLTKEGEKGEKEIKNMMEKFRTTPPQYLYSEPLVTYRDYDLGIEKHISTGKKNPTGLPKSDILQFVFQDYTIVSVRPSGTEPKIKFYINIEDKIKELSHFEKKQEEIQKKIKQIKNNIYENY